MPFGPGSGKFGRPFARIHFENASHSRRTAAGTGGGCPLECGSSVAGRRYRPVIPRAQSGLRLGSFRHRNLSVANDVGISWAAVMFALLIPSALHLQLVLHYSPFKVVWRSSRGT
jgi:hypothetical protein